MRRFITGVVLGAVLMVPVAAIAGAGDETPVAYTFRRFIVPAGGPLARTGECIAEDYVMVPTNGSYGEPGPLAIRCVHRDSI